MQDDQRIIETKQPEGMANFFITSDNDEILLSVFIGRPLVLSIHLVDVMSACSNGGHFPVKIGFVTIGIFFMDGDKLTMKLYSESESAGIRLIKIISEDAPDDVLLELMNKVLAENIEMENPEETPCTPI